MSRESKAAKKERALKIAEAMNAYYPEPESALLYEGDVFKLVIAVLLSAQTTDKGVNRVTPLLWEQYPTIADLAQANPSDVEEILKPIGYYRSKASYCIGCAQMVLSDFGGTVPQTMEELVRLPGVGRKTANIVLNEGFGIVEGIAVDTHVFRIAQILKLSNAKTPEKTEKDLLALYPREYWKPINHQWVLLGREFCIARRPKCGSCPLASLCPSAKLT